MKILIMAGHTLEGNGTGANGYINESRENRYIGKKVTEYLKLAGHQVTYYELNKSNNHLVDQVNYANKGNYDLVVQIHFNAYKNTLSAMGCEVLYYDNVVMAKQVVNSLGKLYKNRGAKGNKDLYWLKNTKASAILVEVCFVDSKADTDKYINNKDYTAKLIAEGIHGKSIEDPKPVNTVKIKIDGKYYDVEGMLVNGTNYIKVRDFSKAGYKIGFEGAIATIDKP